MAYCDASSVQPNRDLELEDNVNDDDFYSSEETYQVYYRPYHKWFYLSEQKNSELAIFRQFDSQLGPGSGLLRLSRVTWKEISNSTIGVPHVAFADPHATGDEELRESIEVQVLVYYE